MPTRHIYTHNFTFSSVAQSCLTLCKPMDCSTPSFPVHHQLPGLAQTHVHRVVISSNHLLLCHPLLFLPSVFPVNIQGWFPLGWTGWISCSPVTSWQIDGETMEMVTDFIFLISKITIDGDCSHEIKRWLLLGRKAMTNLDSILKSRDINLLTIFVFT